MGSPEVSVIVPVYNRDRYVAECVKSVTTQTLGDFELICVDDGSTDESPRILSELASQDERIRIITQDNAGPGAARNTGLKAATGKYVTFLDSDDLFEPEALQTLCSHAEDYNLDELFCTASVFYEPGEHSSFHPLYEYRSSYPGTFSGREIFIRLIENDDFRTPACMQLFRREFLVEEGLSFCEGVIHEDALFTVECIALAQRVRILNAPLYRCRVHEGSVMTGSGAFDHAYGFFACVRDMFGFVRDRGLESDREYLEALSAWLTARCDSAAKNLSVLEEQEILDNMSKLPEDEYAIFKLLVYDRMKAMLQKEESEQEALRLAARMDVKNAGDASNDVEVLELSDPDAMVVAPGWFCDDKGAGHVIRSIAGSLDVRLRCKGSGELSIVLRGPSALDSDGNREPVWIDYTELSVDGLELLGGARAVWHNKPFRHRRSVEDGEVVEVSLAWHSHDERGIEVEHALRDENEALQQDGEHREKELAAAKKELAAAKKELAAAKKEAKALRSSNSWRIGRAITWLPRKVKALIKRIGGGA